MLKPPSAMLALSLALAVGVANNASAQTVDPTDWSSVEKAAEGQTVFFNAWGGSNEINAYIEWAGESVRTQYGVTVEHVKLTDTADAVSRVLSERMAGKDEGGAIDLIWINGENFASMKAQGLLFGPWAEALPNWSLVDVDGKAAVTTDFTVPTEGLEAPWGMAQIVFFHDSARVPEPPRSARELLEWAEKNQGRFAFPQPPNFLGSTFLKQVLMELVTERDALSAPVENADYQTITAPLWAYLDALTPTLWRAGAAYPQNGPRLIQLMADGEIDIALSFNPNEASNAIANFQLPDTVRSYVHSAGTIGNASFVAIPYNANAKEGAMVFANFLLSPEAQARMQDPTIWGSGTVLALDKLTDADRARFKALELGIATLSPDEMGTALPEPHPSWMVRLEEDWSARYGVGQ